jgi:abortive infection bacteriophage resistance protein
VKPILTCAEQVDLLVERGLAVDDRRECTAFLAATNYYRFSGYARYFQEAPDLGGDPFRSGSAVATSTGIVKEGFASRVKALVYLRNRSAHHSRLWHHSMIDAGPTPNNVRNKEKRVVGQFGPRSVIDIVASLDDVASRGQVADPLLPQLIKEYGRHHEFWEGLARPQTPRDHCGAAV